MKLSLNWIKDYVKIPDTITPSKLAYDLTMSTVEVEDVVDLAKKFEGLIIGEIKEVLPHPNADRLRVCKTDIGNGEIKEIVCGGINLKNNMKVVVALPGAMVRWHGEGDLVEIKKAKLRGVESYGMICAASEIGLHELFPAKEEAEITDLSEFDAKVGTPLAKALNLEDIILEIDNKSMTNRPDLWGHYGIAREIAAIYDLPLKEFSRISMEGIKKLDVVVENKEKCPRYMALEVDNVEVKPSPFEMQSRLWKVGLRPINALVDITNYVMLATGQPSHAFDSDNIRKPIIVRDAKKDEELQLLNDKTLKLTENDLVIADATMPVGLAGVMGGSKDSVLDTTKKIILEIANFEPRTIRSTAIYYDNRTEASARYEKALDVERCDLALSLSVELFKSIYPDMKIISFYDECSKERKQNEIVLELKWLEKRLGKNILPEEINKKLSNLGFKVTLDKDTLHIIVPSWRATGDISIKDDIMEEVARMFGYENFEATTLTTTFDSAINQLDVDLVRRIKEYLAFRCNFQEIFTYPWMMDEFVMPILQKTDGLLELSTPPAPNEKYLRSSLLPNICKAIVKNERNFEEFSIFEVAQVFFDKEYKSLYDERERLPLERKHLACALVSKNKDIMTLFRTLKGVIEEMPRYTHMEEFTFSKNEKPVWSDDVVWQNIYLGNEKIGDIGLLSKKSAIDCGIKIVSALLVELDLDALKPFKSRTNTFTHLNEYPMTDYDISFLVSSSVKWEEIYNLIISKKNNNSLLQNVIFVDEYHGKQIPEDKKSITIRLVIGSNEKTLTSTEIEEVANNVINTLRKKFEAEVRDK